MIDQLIPWVGLAGLAIVALVFWIGLTLDRQRAWPGNLILPHSADDPADTGERKTARVTVVVPARNEALVIGRSLPALLAQQRSIERVVLVDDHSTDATGQVAREVAESLGAPRKLRVVEGRPPPSGWTGKLNALQTGIDLVQQEENEENGPSEDTDRWFLFTDADVLHPDDSIERLVAQAARGSYDLVSIMARLSTESRWEKFLIPPFVFFFQLMYPFRRVADPRSKVAAAAGGCILIRRDLLEKIGGLTSMHDAIIDDVTLAQKVKNAGGRCWLGSEDDILSLRGYTTLGEIVDMVARTAFTELRYRYSLVVLTWVILGIFFVSPPFVLAAALWVRDPLAAGLALLTWCLQTASLAPVVRHLRVPILWSALLPFASAVYGAMTTISAWRHFRGHGIVWRGHRHEAEKGSREEERGRGAKVQRERQ